MYNTCVIKNIDSEIQNVLGVELQPSGEYTIPDDKRIMATQNNTLLNGISSGIFQIGNGTTYFSTTADQLKYLFSGISDVSIVNTDTDETGRFVMRYAATIKGWHYQAHSVQFEVNKLGSIYNKDCDGNDLGFATLKIYDDQGTECTTQASADTDGVKTIVKWQPDFDFEIISGNIRQMVKETEDSYVYVRAMAATGLPAPNDYIPVNFVQGGINLNYIGSDEPLKTDGRASKLMKASTNGDYFEIIVNYEANLLNNANRHKMSLIFEIYKDPLS